MAIKKNDLYSSLWASCDELRGGMDASQYKDYVLTMLFIKYISDKYKDQPFGAITVPQGASFDDMVDLIGNPEIGDKINKQILNPIKEANRLSDFPDFNDENKLGKGKDLVDTVSNLIRIFNDPALDFSKNSASGDDILGDAYEYLMRHFATESGKSKGQFYTPAEVSRVLSKVIGITPDNSTNQTSAYDPTCGSGSLLLKVADEAGRQISLYGQEKETTTANLARMNMILHDSPTAEIVSDNTLSRPAFRENNGNLKRFDYVVANPPFSLKNWSNGVNIDNDEFDRFELGVPPEKNGDYAFLLHILKSLKTTGTGAVVLPHGVLFRGNAEGEIRKNILKQGYIKGIIGLPANLFYGTGIPACIIVLDKEQAAHRKGIFMIDASKGFVKDGNKNRLREQDIRLITDVFNAQTEIPKFSRMVPMSEIADAKNDYNLNLPRYIDTQEKQDIQDIGAHLIGGIPERDIADLEKYWKVYPNLKESLFEPLREGYLKLKVSRDAIKESIYTHEEFQAFNKKLDDTYKTWLHTQQQTWEQMEKGVNGKELIEAMSESLLEAFTDNPLINAYDLFQYLMSYWNEVMADDLFILSLEGWEATSDWERLVVKGKQGKDGKRAKDKEVAGLEGIQGRLIPSELVSQVYFQEVLDKLDALSQEVETHDSAKAEIEEEQSGEDGVFGELEKITVGEVKKLLKEVEDEEKEIVENYLEHHEKVSEVKKEIKAVEKKLEKLVEKQYPQITIEEGKEILIHKKWSAHLLAGLSQEQDKISQSLSQKIDVLAERYQDGLPSIEAEALEASQKVKQHLEKMGWAW